MKNLYNISNEIEEILERVDPETGEITEQVVGELDELFTSRDEQVEGLAAYLTDLKSYEDNLKTEIDRLKARLDSIRRRAEHIRDFINANTPDDYKLKTDLFTVYKGSTTKLEMPEADPKDYIATGFVKTKYEWNKEGLKKYMKENGFEQMILSGLDCSLTKSKHIVIR